MSNMDKNKDNVVPEVELVETIGMPVCKPCGYVVHSSAIIRHMSVLHSVSGAHARACSEKIKELMKKIQPHGMAGAYTSREPRDSDDALPPLPHVKITRGYMCETCKIWLGSVDSIRKHAKRTHSETVSPEMIRKTEHAVQNLYHPNSSSSFYFPVNVLGGEAAKVTTCEEGPREEARAAMKRKVSEVMQKIGRAGDEDADPKMKDLGSYLSVTRNDVALQELGLDLQAAHSLACQYDGRIARDAALRAATRRYFASARAALRSCSFAVRREIGRLHKEFNPLCTRAETWDKYDARVSMLAILALRLRESENDREMAVWKDLCELHESTDEVAEALSAVLSGCAPSSGGAGRAHDGYEGEAAGKEKDAEDRLEDALHKHFLAWLIEKPETRGKDTCISKFILLSSCVGFGSGTTRSYRYASGKDVSPTLAALQAASHLVAGAHATQGKSYQDVEGRLKWLEGERTAEMISEPMEAVRFYQNICARLRTLEYRVDRFTLCGAPDHAACGIIDGVEMEVSRIGDALRAMKKRADELLGGDNGLFFGRSAPEWFPQSLECFADKPGVSVPGYSWALSTPAATQLTRGMRTWAVNLAIRELFDEETLKALPDKCDAWERKCEELLEILACMILLSGGGPLRATELANLQIQNTTTSERDVFVINERFVVIPSYNKTRALKQGVVRPTARYLCELTSKVLMRYVLLVLPMRAAIEDGRSATGADANLSFMHTLLPGETAPWRMVERVLNKYGIALTVSQYRQYQRGIVKHVLPNVAHAASGDDLDGREYEDGNGEGVDDTIGQDIYQASLLQAGHSQATAEGLYGCSTSDELSALSPSKLLAFKRASEAWHRLIGTETVHKEDGGGDARAAKKRGREYEDSEANPIAAGSCSKRAKEDTEPDRAPPNGVRDSGEESRRALRMLYGEDAVFRCKTQELVVRSAVERDCDMLAVLPTGGGKGLAYLVPAKLCAYRREQGDTKRHWTMKTTVLVVPLTSLVSDSLRRAQQAGLRALDMTVAPSSRSVSAVVEDALECDLLVCSMESACGGAYATVLKQLSEKDQLGAIVVDEAHLIVQWECFRGVMKQAKERLRPAGVKASLVMLTATCSPRLQGRVIRACGADDEKTVLLRKSTIRKNISYKVERAEGRMCEAVTQIVKKWSDKEGKRRASGIVYCQSRAAAESLATLVRTSCGDCSRVDVYHAGRGERDRKKAMQSWLADEGDENGGHGLSVMVATVAMGVGVDCPCVRFVVHAGAPSSIVEWAQECGRAGRDGADAECTVLLDESFTGPKSSLGCTSFAAGAHWESALARATTDPVFGNMQSIVGMRSGCRRQRLHAIVDGADPGTCRELGARLCDLCSEDDVEEPERESPSSGVESMVTAERHTPPQRPSFRSATEWIAPGSGGSESSYTLFEARKTLPVRPAPAFARSRRMGSASKSVDTTSDMNQNGCKVVRELAKDRAFGRVGRSYGAEGVRLLKEVAGRIPKCGVCFLARRTRCIGHGDTLCYRCHLPGHYASSCPNMVSMADLRGRGCFRCYLYTHTGLQLHEAATFGQPSCELQRFMGVCLLMFWDEKHRVELLREVRGFPAGLKSVSEYVAWLRSDSVDGVGTGAVPVAEYLSRQYFGH